MLACEYAIGFVIMYAVKFPSLLSYRSVFKYLYLCYPAKINDGIEFSPSKGPIFLLRSLTICENIAYLMAIFFTNNV